MGGECPGEAFLIGEGSESSQLLCVSPVYSLFEGVSILSLLEEVIHC